MVECLEVNGRQLFVRVDCVFKSENMCWCCVLLYIIIYYFLWQTIQLPQCRD